MLTYKLLLKRDCGILAMRRSLVFTPFRITDEDNSFTSFTVIHHGRCPSFASNLLTLKTTCHVDLNFWCSCHEKSWIQGAVLAQGIVVTKRGRYLKNAWRPIPKDRPEQSNTWIVVNDTTDKVNKAFVYISFCVLSHNFHFLPCLQVFR